MCPGWVAPLFHARVLLQAGVWRAGVGAVFGWSSFGTSGLAPAHFPDMQLEHMQEQSVPLLTVGAIGVCPLCSGDLPYHTPSRLMQKTLHHSLLLLAPA